MRAANGARRAGVALALAAGLAAPAMRVAAQAVPDFASRARGTDTIDDPRRLALLQIADAALARGDAEAALEPLERAAAMAHTADTELRLVRAWLQRGEFRRALGFCAHTAAAHRDSTEAAALHGWLLGISGQTELAHRALLEAQRSHPDDPLLQQALQRLELTAPAASAPSASSPVAPQLGPTTPDAEPLRRNAQLRANAVLLDGGRLALAPADAVRSGERLWLRDGLGRSARATIASSPSATGFVLLRLDAALPAPALEWAEREPFGGSPAYVVGFAAADGTPAWPRLAAGFLGSMPARGARPLGILLPDGPHGQPVFDSAGRLAGIALRGDGGEDTLVSITALRATLPPSQPQAAPASPAARIGSDQVYERALRSVAQLLAAP